MSARKIVTNEEKDLIPLVSIVIPTFNRAHIIGRAIKSVLAQSFQYFELIIVDDGSKDNTQQVVLSFADERIRYLRHERNQGQNPALNTGVSAARGKFIAFIDSDDEWLPTYLERIMKVYAQDSSLGMVYTNMWGAYPDGRLVRSNLTFDLEGWIYKEALERGYIAQMGSLVVTQECINTLGPEPFDPEFVVCQDDDFCFRVAKEFRIGLIKEPLTIIHSDGGVGRLITNHSANAKGWWKLIYKFQDDILQHCGKGALAKHFFRGAILYLKAGQLRQASDAFSLARHISPSVKNVGFHLLARLPGALSGISTIRRLFLKLRYSDCVEPLLRLVRSWRILSKEEIE